MLLKWIDCHVPPDRRDAFLRAQERWSDLRGVPGFLGQVGGWNRHEPRRAGILALWYDRTTHESFMRHVHDQIVEENRQADTYDRITVAIFESVLDMPGALGGIARALDPAMLLRVADCEVKPERRDHFVEVQRDVWRPGMSRADGMLGGVCGERCAAGGDDVPPRFLVATLWRSEIDHDAYVEAVLPSLRARARTEDDIARLAGRAIVLEPTWRVTPVTKT